MLTDELARVVILLLRMDVDLLWNGAIGTYAKSTDESDIDAGDPAAISSELTPMSCEQIVGEGGNLVPQRGRVEFALSGGHQH